MRINSDIVTWPKKGNNIRREKVPAAPGNRYVGLVLLFSTENGEPLAIFPDGVMQRMRVGAANGLGVKYLARKNAKTVGILGSGWQAGAQLMAVCAVASIESHPLLQPQCAKSRDFSPADERLLGVLRSCRSKQPEEAIKGADIVMCATNTLDPVFFAHWIEPGVHLSSIKRPEIEPKAVKRADRVAIHVRRREADFIVSPKTLCAGESRRPRLANRRGDGLRQGADFAGPDHRPRQGRQSDGEVTCFINNLGLGYQFAAAGSLLYRKAKESGAGHDLPTDWFTEDVHP